MLQSTKIESEIITAYIFVNLFLSLLYIILKKTKTHETKQSIHFLKR
jgi:hypothetical protein